MKYLLDTDTCINYMRQDAETCHQLGLRDYSELAISVITLCELTFGAKNSGRPKTIVITDEFVARLAILDLKAGIADTYADIRLDLKTRGLMIGANDLLLAAHARTLGLILVTNNLREFSRVPHLLTETWSR